ncbi:hypothetical protein Efla_003566 [Eimeria flavescens]
MKPVACMLCLGGSCGALVICGAVCCDQMIGVSPSLEDDPSRVTMWVRDTIALADEVDVEPEVRKEVQEDLMAAAEEILANEDRVLRLVWQRLFQLGSLLFDEYAAWRHLETIDVSEQVDAVTSGVYADFEGTEFLRAVRVCSASELRLEQHAAQVEELFRQVIRAVSLLHEQDVHEVYLQYALLGDFLRQLHLYTVKRRGRADLVHRTALLEALASQGDEAAEHLAAIMRLQQQELVGDLEKQLQEVVAIAAKCHSAGLLFKGGVTILKALSEAKF